MTKFLKIDKEKKECDDEDWTIFMLYTNKEVYDTSLKHLAVNVLFEQY